jgi:hypothetical protein
MCGGSIPWAFPCFRIFNFGEIETAPCAANGSTASTPTSELKGEQRLLSRRMTQDVRTDLATLAMVRKRDLVASENGSVEKLKGGAVIHGVIVTSRMATV